MKPKRVPQRRRRGRVHDTFPALKVHRHAMELAAHPSFGEYVRLWTHMLRTFIGWSDHQVARWALRFEGDIADEYSVFYHEAAEWYVANTVLGTRLVRTVEPARFYVLIREIEGVLRDELVKAGNIDDIDWQPAREKINGLLGKYGESLENVAKERADQYRD